MIKKKISVIATLLVVSSSLMATDWVVDGVIAGSPHDLSGSTGGDNGELCVYCHTPHAGNVAFVGAPLWNKNSATSPDPLAEFTMYGATGPGQAGATIAGTVTEATPSNSSLACLSCHDGVSAIDSIVNAPGSGLGGLADGTKDIKAITNPYGGNIGTDLRNDHPVSIVYTEGKAGLKPTTTTLTNWTGASTVADLLRGSSNDMVECGSCHDPHNGYATQGTDPQVNFLRHTNAGSALCIGCHAK